MTTRKDVEEAIEVSDWAMDVFTDLVLIGRYEIEFEKVEKAQEIIKQALQEKLEQMEKSDEE